MIRDRFAQTREAVIELNEIQALIWSDGDDWHPESGRNPNTSDPTANRAVRNVDEWESRLIELRKREAWLIDFIGLSLGIIEGIRAGLGEEYAAIIEQRYIDCRSWRDVEVDGKRVALSTGKKKVAIAFDWVDSLGAANVLGGRYEL